jgi:osmotically-inducible protein OsmY
MKRFALAVLATLVAFTSVVAPVAAQSRTIGERVDDATITAAVKAKLAADSPKNLVKVDVDTNDGVVELKGTVSSAEHKAEAERLALATKGVQAVKNELTVEGQPAASPSTK